MTAPVQNREREQQSSHKTADGGRPSEALVGCEGREPQRDAAANPQRDGVRDDA